MESGIMVNEKSDIKINTEESITIISFKTSSISNVERIAVSANQVKDFIEKNLPRRIIFDFGEVKFFSSGVLGMLLDARARVENYGGEVVISAINPQLHRVFKITSLDKVFRFFPDKNCAVKAINGN
jgi:anti-sigma B factor antagonist